MICVIRYLGSIVICPKHLKPKKGNIQPDVGLILQVEYKLTIAILQKKGLTAQRNYADLEKFVSWLSKELLALNFVK